MPAPLEQLLVRNRGVKYQEARKIVIAARQELNLSSQRSWDQALYDECLKRIDVVVRNSPTSQTSQNSTHRSNTSETAQETEISSCQEEKKARLPRSVANRNRPVNQARFQQPKRFLAAVRTSSSNTLRSAFSGLSFLSSDGEGPSFFLKRDHQKRTKARRADKQREAKQDETQRVSSSALFQSDGSCDDKEDVIQTTNDQSDIIFTPLSNEGDKVHRTTNNRPRDSPTTVIEKNDTRTASMMKREQEPLFMRREQEPLFPLLKRASIVVPERCSSTSTVTSYNKRSKERKFRSRRLTASDNDSDCEEDSLFENYSRCTA